MKSSKRLARTAQRQANYDEMVRLRGQGISGRGIDVKLPNGKYMCYIRPGSQKR